MSVDHSPCAPFSVVASSVSVMTCSCQRDNCLDVARWLKMCRTEKVSYCSMSSNMVAEPSRAGEADEDVGNRRAAGRIIASSEPSVEGRNLLSVADKNTEGIEERAAFARKFVVGVEAELQKFRDGILALMEKFVDVPVVLQRPVPVIQQAQETEEFIDILVPFVEEEIIEVAQHGLQEHEQNRTEEHIVDMPVPRVVEELAETFKVFFQERVQQRNVEQITETPAVSVAKEIMERTIEETIDIPVPHVVEKTIEDVKLAPQEGVLNRIMEQIIDVPVSQIQETVEVPQMQLIDKAVDVPVVMRRQVPIVQKVQRTVEVPQARFIEQVVDVPVGIPRQVSAVQVVQKTSEIPQIRFIDRMMDTSVEQQWQVPTVQTIREAVETSQAQFRDKVDGMPVVVQRKVPMVRKAQEPVESCTAEQTIDVPVPSVMEEFLEVVKHVPQERVHSNTVEAAKFNPEETGQVIQRIEQGRIHDCGGGDKRIYAKHREKVRQVTVDEMKRLVKEERGDVYAVHGGKIVTSRVVDRLKDGAMIRLVDRVPGGGGKNRKKATKKMVEESEQSATDKSSAEADAVLEMFDRCSQTGVGGWSVEMMEAMSEMDDEQTEKMLKMLRSSFPEVVGDDPKSVVDGLRKFLQERRRREKDQQEESRVQSTDKGEETSGPEEVKSGRGSAGLVRGGDKRYQADETSGKGKGNGGKGEHGEKGGLGIKGAQQIKKMPSDEDEEDERVRVAPNMGAGGSHPQATSDPEAGEEEKVESEQEMQGGENVDSEQDARDEEKRKQEVKEEEEQRRPRSGEAEERGEAKRSEEKRGGARRSEERSRQEVSQERSSREMSEVGKNTRRESEDEKKMKELEEQEKKLELRLEEIRRQQRETRSRLKEMRREFELKEAVTTATEGSDDEEAAVTTRDEAHKQMRKDRMGWYSVSASEEGDGGRQANVEVPPGITVERERNETEDRKRTDDLVARVQKLEEQMRWMHQKVWETTSFTVAFTEDESASWRREGAGGEWQRWKGAWWIKVEQQNLNSRQRRQISRGLRRLTARGREETIGVLEELKDEIRAEWVKANARSTGAQRCKSLSEEECLEAMA